jgi:hypothetical protein
MVLRMRGGVDGLMLDSAPPTAGKRRRINPPDGVAGKFWFGRRESNHGLTQIDTDLDTKKDNTKIKTDVAGRNGGLAEIDY